MASPEADNSSQATLTGYGIGGLIDGQRVTQTVARGPGVILDPGGSVHRLRRPLAPRRDTRVVLDDFNNLPAPLWERGAGAGSVEITETGGELTVRGNWPSIRTRTSDDTTAWVSPGRAWSVQAGRTLETGASIW